MRISIAGPVRALAALAMVASALLAPATAQASQRPTPPPEPLERAHAHNDYEHDRPLLDALDRGFTSVEADVWLVDGELLVAHDREDVDPERTLRALYLDPLRALNRRNHGSAYTGWDGSLQLLIDIKSDGRTTYAALHRELRRYPELMTRFSPGRVHERAVTAVISGERPRELMESQRVRYAGYDGRLSDLDGDAPASFMPLVSDNWEKNFTWRGEGEFPAGQRAKLHGIVDRAHAAGYRIRFWATPDDPGPEREAVWRELVAADVDHLNTDDLPALRDFLLAEDPDERAAS